MSERVSARAMGPYDAHGVPAEGAPAVPRETLEVLRARGLEALRAELLGLRSRDVVRRASVWRALAAGTDVDTVRLRPLPKELGEEPSPRELGDEEVRLDYAIDAAVAISPALASGALVVPRAALAALLVPIVAGLLVDEGKARDLGEAEPLVLAPSAAAFVDPLIDAALEERPLVLTRNDRVMAAYASRGERTSLGPALAAALGARDGDRVVLHLPLGVEAIDEAAALVRELETEPSGDGPLPRRA